jgi:hypothetical protein
MTSGESGVTSTDINREAAVDYFDVRILKAMQVNPTVSLSKVAAELEANPRTLRYHNSEHVVKGKFILNSNVRWNKPILEGRPGDLMQLLVLFRGIGEPGVVGARKLLNKIPFTWVEGGSETGDYFALLDVPMERLYETTRFIETNTEDNRSRLTMLMLDGQSSKFHCIPDEMFDAKRGWTLPGYRGEMAKVEEEGQRQS